MMIRAVHGSLATALFACAAAGAARAQASGVSPEYWRMGWGWGWGHMVFGSLMMLLFWGAVVLAIVLAVRHLGGSGGRVEPDDARPRPLAILEERFARGETDKEEFEERKRLLSR